MTVAAQPIDARERGDALDPTRSFIVQAPAGSGKTELLIQRFLRLLAVVNEPEEILAITFTRKAAGEMRTRIETALQAARTHAPPEPPHLRLGYELALEVVARDRQRAWGLGDQPSRLRISTIDSVNTRLSRRAPFSAGLTAQNAMLDDARPIYREAARETLALAEETGGRGEAMRTLLAHCDNDAGRVEHLLQTMLGRRDQWLSRTGSGRAAHQGDLRDWLEDSLREVVEHFLVEAERDMPATEREEIVACLAHAGTYLAIEFPDSDVAAWKSARELPRPNAANLQRWRGMAAVLLTKDRPARWRSRPNRTNGFPVENAAQRDMKARVTELLARLGGVDEFRAALEAVRDLPDPCYPDAQWGVIESLWEALPLAVAVLKQLFAERGQTDYTEVAQEAIAALGDDDEATELRLVLDYQIRHMLVDEFQDTSRSQYELIRKLTDGWELELDRSVFLVGDPMQSIYRFREADVRLFLETRERGLGGIRPEFLRLATNFRSDRAVVEWFNQAFAEIFPAASDLESGAVAFAASDPFLGAGESCGVSWHPVPAGLPEVEADRIVALICDTLAARPGETIGVLVRSRNHAAILTGRLRAAGVEFLATALDRLHEQPLVQDLLALTRALVHPGDRLAWLACLRAPWCGLTLADLRALAAPDHDACVWTLINDPVVCARLTDDGRLRVARCRNQLEPALQRRGAIPLRDLVESAWLALGGPATVAIDSDLELADLYFTFLDSLDVNADCVDGAELIDLLSECQVTRGGGDPQVQILTMHKSKGLEFDSVILPGLGLTTRASDKPLLLFDEIVRDDASSGLVVAPIKSSEQSADPIYDLLWRFERERDRYEQDRLLYVAVTRARCRLHLFAQLELEDSDAQDLRRPAANTLLSRLWPVAAREIDPGAVDLPVRQSRWTGERRIEWGEVSLRRLPANWQAPVVCSPIGHVCQQAASIDADRVEFEWASAWAKHVGSVVHRWLQFIAEDGVANWDADRVTYAEPLLRRALRRAGVARDDLQSATDRTTTALRNTLDDERARWILSSDHAESANELALTTPEDDRFATHVIDRTFVGGDGTRWIIDYKTSSHEGSNIDGFLASEEERYRPQLRRYRDVLAQLDSHPVRTALYFPLLQVFHEVDCEGSE